MNAPAILELMKDFPSVTAIDVEAALNQVRDVMDKAAIAVQAVFLFTLVAGIIVLWAAVQSTADERRYESAMLRTLGAKRSRSSDRRRNRVSRHWPVIRHPGGRCGDWCCLVVFDSAVGTAFQF